MFQIESFTEARLSSVTNRIEKHGDDDAPAVSLGLEITCANTLLDSIDPSIRHALYKAVDDQEQLPGIEPSTPVLRCNSIDRVTLSTAHEGWTLAVDDGIDNTTPMMFGGTKVDKFSVEAKQGGSVVLRLRVGTSDVDAERLGSLAVHNGQSIWITLTPPKAAAPTIDGSVAAFKADHPEADATDLFSAGAGPEEEGGEDNEGSHPDAEAEQPTGVQRGESWPFPGAEPGSPGAAFNETACGASETLGIETELIPVKSGTKRRGRKTAVVVE